MTFEYSTIAKAAEERQWEECDRLMFIGLYSRKKTDQRKIASAILGEYLNIWRKTFSTSLHSTTKATNLWAPDLANTGDMARFERIEQQNPANAEFENGLLEFQNGLESDERAECTKHFASAIRSAVLAFQINRWTQDHPAEFELWRQRKIFRGPTFLDDPNAAEDAENAWKLIEKLLGSSESLSSIPADEAEKEYKDWQASLL